MITKEIVVNGTKFRLTLTDQIISQVNNLKSLYNTAYEDPESFDQVSAEISSTINEISEAAEPHVSDGDLDGLIQEVIKVVDDKAAEVEKELQPKNTKSEKKSVKIRSKKAKSRK